MEIEINGKKTTPRFDIGMVKLFNKETGKNFLKMSELEYEDIGVMSGLIYAAAKRGNKSITMDDVDCLKFSEMIALVHEMEDSVQEFLPQASDSEEGEGAGPLEENRQS